MVAERKREMEKGHGYVLWIARTGVLIALLVALQWLTAGTSAFAGQYITGTCVNAVLAIAVLTAGLWSGVVVAVLSPFCAFLLGIGPKLIQIVPAIAVGNVLFVVCLHALLGKAPCAVWRQALGLLASAAAKFAALYLLVVRLIVPAMGATLKAAQIKTFSAMFSWPQLVTALTGGVLALLIVPLLRKAIRK